MCKCDVAFAPNPSGTYMIWGTICPIHIKMFRDNMDEIYQDGERIVDEIVGDEDDG